MNHDEYFPGVRIHYFLFLLSVNPRLSPVNGYYPEGRGQIANVGVHSY